MLGRLRPRSSRADDASAQRVQQRTEHASIKSVGRVGCVEACDVSASGVQFRSSACTCACESRSDCTMAPESAAASGDRSSLSHRLPDVRTVTVTAPARLLHCHDAPLPPPRLQRTAVLSYTSVLVTISLQHHGSPRPSRSSQSSRLPWRSTQPTRTFSEHSAAPAGTAATCIELQGSCPPLPSIPCTSDVCS
jgi:hypothetical protein